MAGGDMHVRVHASYGQFAVNQVIDANKTPAGNMQTKVTVGNEEVYMTAQGAEQYNMLKEDSYGTLRFSAHNDVETARGGFLWLFTKQVNNLPQGHAEQHLGDPNAVEG